MTSDAVVVKSRLETLAVKILQRANELTMDRAALVADGPGGRRQQVLAELQGWARELQLLAQQLQRRSFAQMNRDREAGSAHRADRWQYRHLEGDRERLQAARQQLARACSAFDAVMARVDTPTDLEKTLGLARAWETLREPLDRLEQTMKQVNSTAEITGQAVGHPNDPGVLVGVSLVLIGHWIGRLGKAQQS